MIILDIDKPERCGKCPMHHDGNDYCKLAHDHASFVRAKGCPIQTIKTGHWIDGDDKCPCCGKSKFEGLDADIWADWQPKYCPNCGAKMVEPQESEVSE